MKRRYRLAAQELAAYEAANLAAAEAAGPSWVPPTPRPAAAVILIRDTESEPEVLLVRRRSDVGFAAGAFVFPGGTLDAEDDDPRWEDHLDPPPAHAVAGAADGETGGQRRGRGRGRGPTWRALVVGALREMFEETGVLLSKGEVGREMVNAARAQLVAGERGFLEIVTGLGVRLAGEDVVLCARWITPEALPRRYDARFFIAESPAEIEIAPELGELVEHVWVTPAAALQRYVEDEFPMMFPTAVTLGWFEEGDSAAEWRQRFLEREIKPITPRLRRVDGEVRSVLPDEPGYEGGAVG